MNGIPINEEQVFDLARRIESPDAQRDYIEQVCGADPALKARIEELLRLHTEEDGFFSGRPVGLAQTIEARTISEKPGDQIGPYKLLQQIGEGGMGVVYMAEQTKPIQRMVALKIIKPGMDTRQVVARFEVERQALAMMDHPNIAKVLDAGTTDSGRPYFVMELVKGVPITNYCDDHHLTPKQRLELFVDVLHAVQHAHQKGIIHRDIKPSNVLVAEYDQQPIPKVIDFGVAKATHNKLTDKTMFTQFGQLVGTLEYMSPEQAKLNQMDIDTRCDIYSLGVLLYELLSGETPFDRQRLRSAAFEEMMRIIREENPPAPSTRLSSSALLASLSANRSTEPRKLSLFLRGELDWIVMRAMEKERNRRYETPNAFADDIQRFLNQEAIVARPASTAYRMKKFAQRNWAAVVTGTVIAGTLLLASGVSTWLAIRASRAGQAAVASAREALIEKQEANAQRDAAKTASQQESEQRKLAEQREADALAAREELRHTLYAANMSLIQSSWESQQFDRVRFLLDTQSADESDTNDRGWEWHFWQRRLKQVVHDRPIPPLADNSHVFHGRGLSGDTNKLVFLEFAASLSESGERSLAGESCEVVIQDSRSGHELLRVQPFSEATGTVASHFIRYSHDGSRIAIYLECDQTFAAIFDGNSGAKLRDLPVGKQRPTSGHFSKAGDRFVASCMDLDSDLETDNSSRQTIQVWDVATGDSIYRYDESVSEGKLTGAISRDGSKLLRYTTFDDDLFHSQRWELVDLAKQNTLWQHIYENTKVTFESWSQDGSVIAVAIFTPAQPEGCVQLWDGTSGETFVALLRPSEQNKHFSGDAAISPDGQRLALLGSTVIQLFDIPPIDATRSGQFIQVAAPRDIIPYYGPNPWQVAFTPDGSELVLRTQDSIKAWRLSNIAAANTVALSSEPQRPNGACFSPDATKLAFLATSGKAIQIWDTYALQLLCQCELAPESAPGVGEASPKRFSQDGRRILTYNPYVRDPEGDNNMHLWVHDTASGNLVWDAPIPRSGIALVDMNPRGDQVAIMEAFQSEEGSKIATLQLWDLASGRLIGSSDVPDYREVPGYPHRLTYVRNGSEIALNTRENDLLSMSFWNEGPIKPSKMRSAYHFFDANSLRLLRKTAIDGMSFVDSSRRDIVAADDGNVSFYDVETGSRQILLSGFLGLPISARSPDGKRMAIASSGPRQAPELTIWSVEYAHRLLTLPIPGRPVSASFSADGNRLMVVHFGSAGGLSLSTWDATQLPEGE